MDMGEVIATFLIRLYDTTDKLSLILLAIGLSYAVYSGIIKIKWFKRKKKNALNPHIGCVNYESLQKMINTAVEEASRRASDRMYRIIRIKRFETIYEQMNEADLAWIKVSDMLKEHFYEYVDEQDDLTELEKQHAVKYYNAVIDTMAIEVKGLIRRWMIKNHFMEKSDIEYKVYVTDKFEALSHKITLLMDYSYLQSLLKIERRELHNKSMELVPQMQAVVNDFFNKARTIAKEKYALVEELEKESSVHIPSTEGDLS